MNDETPVLTKNEAVKRHVLGLKDKSHVGGSVKIPITAITVGERIIPEDPKLVAQLKTSIREVRQATPILVRRSLDEGYMLVDGLNRLAALKELGETEVLATVLDVSTEEEAKACEAISNSHRRQRLTALDRALTDSAFVRYVALKVPQDAAPRGGRQPKEKFYAKAARELGVSPDQIARSCKIAKIVPYVQNAVRNYKEEDNQSLLIEVAASGEDLSAQVHTLTRLMNKIPEPTEEPWSNPLPWPPSGVGAKDPPPVESQPTSSNHGLAGPAACDGNAEPLRVSTDNVPAAIGECGDTEVTAAAQNHSSGKSPAALAADGGEQGGTDQPDTNVLDLEGIDAEPGTPIQLDIPQGLRAKMARLADGSAIQIFGYVRARLGLQPSIEVQDIAARHVDEI
jgi:hypothetical protein